MWEETGSADRTIDPVDFNWVSKLSHTMSTYRNMNIFTVDLWLFDLIIGFELCSPLKTLKTLKIRNKKCLFSFYQLF